MNAHTIRQAAEAHALELAEAVWGDGQRTDLASPGGDWHIVHCVGRSDRHAIDWLTDRKFEVYYPVMRELRAVPKKQLSKKQRALDIRKPRLVPFLPRYMFVRFDMGREGWRDVFKFAGVGGMVCEGDLPVLVPARVVDELRAREIDGAIPGKTPAKYILKVDEVVRVLTGPFAAFHAVVERLPDIPIENIDSDTRIRVAVQIFGRSTPIDLEVSQIEKL